MVKRTKRNEERLLAIGVIYEWQNYRRCDINRKYKKTRCDTDRKVPSEEKVMGETKQVWYTKTATPHICICYLTTLFQKIETMGIVGHGHYRHPWPEDTYSGHTPVFPTSWVTPVLLILLWIEGGDLYTILVPLQFKRVLGFRGVGNRCQFGTMRTILTIPLDATSQQHHNQPATPLVWAETAGGLLGGFAFRRGKSIILCS